MTKYHKESKQKVLDRDNYRCQHCLKWPVFSVAHRIARTKENLKYFGEHIINHPFNLVAACEDHNDKYNIGNNPAKCKKLVGLINRMGNEPMNEALVVFINDLLSK